jgi:type I restriction enzyme M protein
VARGFRGLVEAWTSTIVAAVENGSSKENPLDHKLVRLLLPEHLHEVEELQEKKSELEAKIKAAQPSDDENAQDEEAEEALSEAELKALKKELGEVKKALKAKQHGFLEALEDAHAELEEDGARDLVLRILRNDLSMILKHYITNQRQNLITSLDTWWDKYQLTLVNIQRARDEATKTLQGFLASLGYG